MQVIKRKTQTSWETDMIFQNDVCTNLGFCLTGALSTDTRGETGYTQVRLGIHR